MTIDRKGGWRRRRTALPTESWSDQAGEQPRVLLTCPAHATPSAVAVTLGRAGFDVAICEGQAAKQDCALLDHGSCPLVPGADIVVDCHGVREGPPRDLLVALREHYPEKPVLVEVTMPESEPNQELLRDTHVLHPPISSQRLIDEIRSTLEESADQRPGP